MDWTILGIAPTDDKKAITAAYRAKLRTTNPEDKPEEFRPSGPLTRRLCVSVNRGRRRNL